MTRLFRLAVRLYPAWWRRRYARELEALLEDMQPGWRGLFDVVMGAFAMQITTVRSIPVVCALAGAVVGGVLVARTPDVFASSATLRLDVRDAATGDAAFGEEIRGTIDQALVAANGSRAATSVVMAQQRSSSPARTIRLTYSDTDPAQARRVAAALTAALASERKAWLASSQVLSPPDLPAAPIEADYLLPVGSGAAAGLLAGGLAVLLLRSRRRPGNA
jgi:hypothetical protein